MDRVTRAVAPALRWPLFWAGAFSALFVGGVALPRVVLFASPLHYLPVHTAMEFVAVSVSLMVFGLSWNLRREARSSHAVVLGTAFLAVALIDFAHTLSYDGMPRLVTPSDPEKAINFWLAGRVVTAVALASVALLPVRRWPERAYRLGLAAALATVGAVWWVGLYHAEWLPRTFIPGQGLTRFKILVEYALATISGAAAIMLVFRAVKEDRRNFYWLASGSWILGLAECFFTFYGDVSDIFNVLGHLFKDVAYYIIYRTFFVGGVRAPYEALARERSLLRCLIDSVPDLIFFKTKDLAYIGFNKAFAEYCGHSEAEMAGRTDYSFAPPQAAMAYRMYDRQVLTSNRASHNEEWITYPDGRKVLLDTLKTPYFGPDGKVLGLIGVSRNITARKGAEVALRDSEAKFRSYIEHSPLALFVVAADGQCVDFNPAALRMLACPPAFLASRPLSTIAAADDGAAALENFAAIAALGPIEQEYRFKTFDGRTIWVALQAVKVSDDRYLAFCQDITARKQDQNQLRQAATVFTCTQEGVVITDLRGIIQAVNPAYCRITGYQEEDLVRHHVRIVQSGRHGAAFYRQIWDTVASTGYWQGELWNRRKTGDIFPVWLTISAVYDKAGRPRAYVGTMTDITSLKQSEWRLEHLAHHDPLTDLPNRLLLQSRLEHAITRARRNDTRGAILFLDLDRFKTINDSLGHAAGDELLQQVARRQRDRLRASDTLARLGGDEFVVLLEDLPDAEDAAATAQALIDRMADAFVLSGGHEVFIGTSIGISLFPDDGQTAEQILQHADAAMYQAKGAGRNTYRYYTEALTLAANARLGMEARLRRGLDRQEFRVHYQPLVSVADRRIKGVEALLRWDDANLGLVPPSQFIPVAEDSGLIIRLGAWVLRSACLQMREWLQMGLPLETIAVNLSPLQFRQSDIHEVVKATLAEVGLPAHCLELEITEGALMESGRDAVARLGALKALGVRVAIDDFGTGYSSLSYLKRFPIDKLKVDQSFVSGIPDDPADMEITAVVIGLAKSLNLEVLAEGVETEAQLGFLQKQGCHTAQGYLFSRPLPAEQIEAMVRHLEPC